MGSMKMTRGSGQPMPLLPARLLIIVALSQEREEQRRVDATDLSCGELVVEGATANDEMPGSCGYD